MRRVCLATLMLATVGTGLVAGLALTYAIAVMPGLAETGDRTFVESFRQIDQALDSATWFWIPIFLGSLLLIVLSIVFMIKNRSIVVWLIVAGVLYAVTIAITAIGIDPLENDFGRASDPSDVVDVATVRADLDEDRWALLNGTRLITSAAAFACLAWTLVLVGRSTSRTDEERR